jgi:hypothetical protein
MSAISHRMARSLSASAPSGWARPRSRAAGATVARSALTAAMEGVPAASFRSLARPARPCAGLPWPTRRRWLDRAWPPPVEVGDAVWEANDISLPW